MGQQQRSRRGCSLCRILNFLVSMAFLGVGGYMIWYFLGQPDLEDVQGVLDNLGDLSLGDLSDFSDVLGNLTNFDFGDLYDTDPFVNDNTTSAWPTRGEGGLELDMLNALDETWQSEYAIAIDDWENGTPDALTLKSSRGDVDYSCTKKDGLQKVCSANFGDTGWLGLNELVKTVAGGIIQSSVAKMNEYYLRNADNAERQFTMCHEIGHGFGLPHTDESFTNPSLGNCMDYTNKPEENMHPDESNYNRLASVYGTVSRRRLGRSLFKQQNRDDDGKPLARVLSEDLELEYESAVAELEQLQHRRGLAEDTIEDTEWRVLSKSEGGASYSRKLGEQFVIEAHVLHTLQPNN